MKRDWELIRKILVVTEAQPPHTAPTIEEIAGNEWKRDVVVAHVRLLTEAGYINARILTGLGNDLDQAVIIGITMHGYDLLEHLRSDTVWGKIKSIAKDKGVDLSFEAVKLIAPMAIKALLGN
jgi:hypothetical protein